MAGKFIYILDPVSLPGGKGAENNVRPKTVEGITVAMVDNTKPNFNIVLDTMEEILLNQYKVGTIKRYRKPGRTVPLDPAIIAEIKQSCDIVITGLGD